MKRRRRDWKTEEMTKRARAAATSLVAFQSKRPVPRSTRTIWARRTIKSAVMGSDQKMICFAVAAIRSTNSVKFFSAKSLESAGKAAKEYETPTMVKGTDWRLIENESIETEPTAIREAKDTRKIVAM